MCMKYVDLSQYDNGWFRIGAGVFMECMRYVYKIYEKLGIKD